ncbi:MAG: hydroxyethylthiazole kinase [Firmicutes bacterium]|nr:hydroxyethylthiazole kinase [Bacillota bacterium]
MLKECLENVRKNTPLVHNITNYVTVNDVANVILACGASPIMADDEMEVEDITSICGGLNINIGTLNSRTIKSMIKAGKKANLLNHPVLLDPVGVGASQLRSQTAKTLVQEIQFSVIRGNISEIKGLALGSSTTQGVDANMADTVTDENLMETIQVLKQYAKEMHCVIAVTGAIDLVTDAQKCYVIRNGRKEMSSITGTGCQLSGMITAFLVANPGNFTEAAAAAVCTMGLAGEIGYSHLQAYEGNSTYRNRIIDAIYNMDGKTLEEGAKYEIY